MAACVRIWSACYDKGDRQYILVDKDDKGVYLHTILALSIDLQRFSRENKIKLLSRTFIIAPTREETTELIV